MSKKNYTPDDVERIIKKNNWRKPSVSPQKTDISGEAWTRASKSSTQIPKLENVDTYDYRSELNTEAKKQKTVNTYDERPKTISGANDEIYNVLVPKPVSGSMDVQQIPVLKDVYNGNVSDDVDWFLSDDYKMADSERKSAKKYADQYLKDYTKKMKSGEISASQYAQDISDKSSEYSKMLALSNKSDRLASFAAGLISSMPFSKSGSDKVDQYVNEKTGYERYGFDDTLEDAQTQNPFETGAGNFVGQAAKYSAAGSIMDTIPALSAMKAKTASGVSKLLGGGEKAVKFGESSANVLRDLALDIGLDTIPSLVNDVEEGKSKEEIAKNAAKNVGINTLYNVGGEAVQTILPKFFSRIRVGNEESIENNIKKGSIMRVSNATENQSLPRTSEPQPAFNTSNNILPTNSENVKIPSLEENGNFVDNIAEISQKTKSIPKSDIPKTSKLAKLDSDVTNLVKWYGDDSDIDRLVEFRKALSDFENTGSIESLTRIDEIASQLEASMKGKTYTYKDRLNKNGSIKRKGETYTYGDTGGIDSALEDALSSIDEIYTSKLPKSTKTNNMDIPYLRDGVNSNGKVLEESYSNNIGKGRVNNVDQDVQNSFIDNPNLYTQLSNAETTARAQQIYDSGNARSEIYRLLAQKDPASIPLGNRIVGDLIDEGKQDEAVELLRTMSGKLRESGQFTQAAAITMMKSDPETALRYAVRNIDDLNASGKQKYGNKWNNFSLTDSEIDMFRNIGTGDKEAIKQAYEKIGERLAKEYPSTKWEKVVELSRIGMLLNPRTNIRNVVSNALLQPVRSLADRVSALGQNAIHLINPDFKVTQSITGGGKSEKKVAAEVWDSVKDAILDNTSKWEDLRGVFQEKQVFKGSVASKAFDAIFPGAIEKANKAMGKNVDDSLLETARNFTYYLLEKGDEPFVKKNFINRLASYMKAQGIKSIDEIPEDAIMLAKDEALKATFKDDNNFTNMLSSIKKNLGKGGEVIMPFTKTPANLAMRGVDYSPAGIVNTIKKAKNGADIGRIMDDLSKNITGTAAIALGFYLTKEGLITGALSSDKDEAAFQKQQGQLAYSIKVGDNYYNYDWAQPAAIPLILGAAIAQSIEESDNEEKTFFEKVEGVGNIAHQAVTSAADAWIELSPLQTISDIFNTGYGGSVPENVINELLEYPQRLIPSLSGAIARTVDTTQRQTYSAGDPIQTQIDTAKSKIPFLSKTLPAAYDTWGREIKRSDSVGESAFAQMLNPGMLGNSSTTPIDGEIQRLYEATESKSVFPQKSSWTVDGKKLSNREYSELQKKQGNLSYNMAETMINDSAYANMDDSVKAETIADVYALSKALAENSVVGKDISQNYQKAAQVYNDQGIEAAVTYLKIGNMDGSGTNGSLKKDDWIKYLDDSSLTPVQKAYIYRLKYKSDNPFD